MVTDVIALDANDSRHIEVSLRMIGHQILLNSGDSTSLVLPIVEDAEGYRIEFEKDFEFNPAQLVATIESVVRETKIAESYLVEVVSCETDEVVYSYEMGSNDISLVVPCGTRNQPKACYSLVITLLEPVLLYSNDSDKDQFNYSAIGIPVLLLLLFIGIFILQRSKKRKQKINPNLIAIGQYQFDKRNSELLVENRKIVLSSKESDLLQLLYDSVNATVEREIILKNVWGDDGDYVGRTLDVFISKLRKKLQADANLKIVNIRGIGYKLILNE